MKLIKKNKGFTLVEILLVVGFIALAGIGIYTIYSKVSVSNQANIESRNLDTLHAGVKSLYAGNPTFTGLTTAVTVNSRIAPDSMRNTATSSLTNTFGGNVTVDPATFPTGSAANNAFTITYPLVSSAVCPKLVSSAGAQFNRVTVGGVAVKDTSLATLATVDVALLTTNCNAAAGSVQIVFTASK